MRLISKIIFIFIMFNFFSNSYAKYEELAYDFKFNSIDGEIINFKDFENKVILVVNVASRCGFTNQYEGLQKLWTDFKDEGLIVVGVPTYNFKQEPGTNKEIKKFCENTFGVDFLITEKVNVIGQEAHPFYKWAKKNHGLAAVPKWNFHKILINNEGKIIKTFSSITRPSSTKFVNFIKTQFKN